MSSNLIAGTKLEVQITVTSNNQSIYYQTVVNVALAFLLSIGNIF